MRFLCGAPHLGSLLVLAANLIIPRLSRWHSARLAACVPRLAGLAVASEAPHGDATLALVERLQADVSDVRFGSGRDKCL